MHASDILNNLVLEEKIIIFTAMHRMLRLFWFLSSFFIIPFSLAQSNSSKADKYFARAQDFYSRGNEEKAIAYLREAIKAQPSMNNAYADLGQWLYKARRYQEAMAVYEQGERVIKDGVSLYAMAKTKCALALYDATTASSIIQRYGNASTAWKALTAQANFIKQHYKPQTQDSLHKLSLRINTDAAESFATMSADEQKLLYTTRIKGLNEALFVANWDSCTNDWFSGRPLAYPINSPLQNAAATLSADEHYLFFMRCDNKSDNGWDNGECDLYMAYRADSIWSTPESFGGTINSTGYEGTASLSPDNKALYFASDRPGGFGGKDIWVCFFDFGKWQRPINLGPTVNTSGDELAPFISPDNQTLYFVSNGWPGMGGLDIFRTRKKNDTLFTQTENLGYPFNSSANEVSMTVNANAVEALICSDRAAHVGQYDVFVTKLPERLQPDAVTYVKGYVYDSTTKERVTMAQLELFNVRTGLREYRFVSNRGDGSFMMSLPLYEKFVVHTDRVRYQERLDTLMLTEKYLATPLVLNLSVLPEGFVPPIFEKTVATFYFEKNAIQLKDSVKALLEEVLSRYSQNESAKIIVNSYTDNSGTPMLNEQISTQRAEAVRDYILQKGWDDARVSAIGWGESSPITNNETEADRDKNRRVELLIQTEY